MRPPLRAHLFVLTCVASLLSHPSLFAQKHPNSPVFRDYKSVSPSMGIQQSDATYQLWQGFMVARKANAGDPLAQHELGIRYLTGKGFEPDTVKAAYWIRRAAEQNVTTARFNLGIVMLNGWGTDWNPFDAYVHFRYCAEHQMPQAQYLMGQFLTENLVVPRNWPEAYRWVKLAADSGYAPAKDVVASFEKQARGHDDPPGASSQRPVSSAKDSIVQHGRPGITQPTSLVFLDFSDEVQSQPDERVLLKEVLLSGSPEVRNALGSSTVLDDTLALDSLRLISLLGAANIGSPEAMTVLGRCYEKGILFKQDIIVAATYYVRALRLDSPRAGSLLMNVVQQRHFAAELKSRAEQSDPDAQFTWAGLFELGLDPLLPGETRLTDDAALQLLKKAAEHNHVPALNELGVCYYSGRWVKQDRDEAVELWRKAVGHGSGEAEVRVAVTTIRASQSPEEKEGAIRVLLQAAGEGSIVADVTLAYCFESGLGLPRSKAEAVRLYRISAQRGSQDAYLALRRMHDEIRPASEEFRIPEQ